jgi:hypothetical protein
MVFGIFGKVMDTLTTAFVHPIKTVTAIVSPTKTVAQVTKEHFAQPLSKQLTETVLTTAGYAGAVLGAGAVASKGLLASAQALIPATTKGKIIASIVAPVALGAVIKTPSTLGKVAELPAELGQFGGDVSTFIAEPSLASAKEILKESPIISATLGAVGLVAVGTGVANVVSGVLTRKEMEEQTAIFQEQADLMAQGQSGQLIKEKSLGSGGIAPTQETQDLTPSRKRRKSRTAKKTPSVMQSVRLNIINNNKNAYSVQRIKERYINEPLYN